MRQTLDYWRDRVRALKTGALNSFYENYFPHYWKDPVKAEDWLHQWFRNRPQSRPMEGSKSFTKQRTIPTVKDGIDVGFEPLSYNPVDLYLWKLREMRKYVFAHEFLNEMKDKGLNIFKRGMGKVVQDRTASRGSRSKTASPPSSIAMRRRTHHRWSLVHAAGRRRRRQ